MPFAALLAFTFILFLAPQSVFPVLASVRIALVVAALGLASFLLDRSLRGRPLSISTVELRTAAVLAGWAVITVPWSLWPGGSVLTLTELYLKSLVVFWLIANTVNTSRRLRGFANAMAWLSLPLALTGLNNYRIGNYTYDRDAYSRISGYDSALASNPNDLALLLNLVLPLTVALFISARRTVLRLAWVALIILQVAAIIVTYSRGGFLGLATVLVSYQWRLLRRGKGRLALAMLILALSAIPFLPSTYLHRITTMTDFDEDPTGSAQGRWDDMGTAFGYVLRHPIIGAGLGQDVLALNEERGPLWSSVHNIFLQHAVDLGLPGVALFLILLLASVRSTTWVQARTRSIQSGGLFHLAEGLQVSLMAFAVGAFFAPVAYHFYVYYLAGLAVAAKQICLADHLGMPAAIKKLTARRSAHVLLERAPGFSSRRRREK